MITQSSFKLSWNTFQGASNGEKKIDVLDKPIEQFWKRLNMVFGQKV
jgi:hypothetical protein